MSDRTDVGFAAVDGTKLAGWLYKPTGAGRSLPAITMSHGFGATLEHGLDAVGRAFADAGFVVLAHDHRTFGYSGGEPRQDIDPWRQVEDWRRAISFLEAVPEVDPARIGIWGTSFSGGHALVLGATDRRVKAVVAQVPTIDGWASGQRRVAPQNVEALDELFSQDQRAQFSGEPAARQKFFDLDPAVTASYHTRDTADFLGQSVPEGLWANEVTLQSTWRARAYEPGRWIDRISPTPLLLIVADHDTTAPTDLALAAYERALEPKSLLIIPGGHYAPYLDAFTASSKAATDFFADKLG